MESQPPAGALTTQRFLYIWCSWDCASLMYSFKYNKQDATLYNILCYCQCFTCFRRFLRPSSGTQKLYTAYGICQACLLLPLAVAASKLDIYLMLCVKFWAPDDGRRNRLKHVNIENNGEYCIALNLVGYTWKNRFLYSFIWTL